MSDPPELDGAGRIGALIEAAAGQDELDSAAARIDELVRLLHSSGTGAEHIGRIASALHARLMARLWLLLAPPALLARSCLLVMGSEGRGEQILRTDQDNALLLRDGFELPGLGALTARYSQALAQLGWPPCPGGIMLSKPLWCQPLAGFRETLRGWVHGGDGLATLHLAIFADAVAVAGETTLLAAAHEHLERLVQGAEPFFARFAAAADQFAEPGWWQRLSPWRDAQPLDVKKLGLFPIVHGVRALALQYGLRATGTAPRLQALVAEHRVPADLAQDALGALHTLMGLRLEHQLRRRALGEMPGNELLPAQLDRAAREQLHAALAVVRRFRAWLREHFHLDAL